MDCKRLTWTEFNRAADAIADHYEGKVSCVTGIPRGGLPLAVAVSQRLGIPYHDLALCSKNYDRGTPLVIDDIYDTGTTVSHLKPYLSDKCVFAYWICRRSKKPKNAFVATVVQNRDWIVFPWEVVRNAKKDKAEYESRR